MKSKDPLRHHFEELSPPPAPDAAAQSRALALALEELVPGRRREDAAQQHPRLIWNMTWATLGVAVAALLLWSTTTWQKDGREDLHLLHEMSALFQNRLSAVVEAGEKVEVLLSPREVPLSEQPMRIILRRGTLEVYRILTYSGRQVWLDLGGESICLDMLTTPEGKAILAGDNFFWSPEHPSLLAGYQIEAAPLPPLSI